MCQCFVVRRVQSQARQPRGSLDEAADLKRTERESLKKKRKKGSDREGRKFVFAISSRPSFRTKDFCGASQLLSSLFSVSSLSVTT
mmetsp:Transcript_51952/g.101752  ORF Transcript_51952/g.101752 Transcript_51952/m.101752 type:complete len:86 (-) Transcript_51952:186-443(-)